jgi:molecular chaperone HscB
MTGQEDGSMNFPLAVAQVSSCWSCKGPVATRALFCSVCGAVQGPGSCDHFSRLGLAIAYDVDVSKMEQQYFGLQRKLHPDRFGAKSAKEKALSQQQATQLNDAYETLKDPLKRAAYLLELLGQKVNLHGSVTISDPILLMEQMERREAIAEASTPEAIAVLIAWAEADLESCQRDMADAFSHSDLARAADLALRLKYFTKMVEDARQRKVRLTRTA